MSVLRDLRKLRALGPVERRLLARALLLLPAYAVGIRMGGLRAMRRRFRWLRPVEGATPDQAVRMLAAVARRAPWARGCLPAALTLQRLLAAQGIESEVRLGVRKAGAHVQAHAWVESGGTTLFDTAAAHERFEVLERAAAPRP